MRANVDPRCGIAQVSGVDIGGDDVTGMAVLGEPTGHRTGPGSDLQTARVGGHTDPVDDAERHRVVFTSAPWRRRRE